MNNGVSLYIVHSRYRPMYYILLKEDFIEVNPMRKPASTSFKTSMHLVKRSDTSCGIYPRGAFMTVFAKHPEAITDGGYYKIQ